MQMINVLVADDHDILRFGVVQYLSSAEDVNVVGEASTGDECIELFKEHRPELCILDISMPEKDGIQTAMELRKIDADVKIMILSMHINKDILDQVLEADINGYLLKNTEKADMLQAVRSIMKGQQVFSEPISKLITSSYLNKSKEQTEPETNEADDINITKREREILSLIVEGLTSQEIADKLYISPRTVDTHRFNLMQKLDIKNTAGLVRFALQNNLVSLEE